MAALQPNGILL